MPVPSRCLPSCDSQCCDVVVRQLLGDSTAQQTRARPDIIGLPQSTVLQQLQQFLPQLQSANADLAHHPLTEPAVSIVDVHEESACSSSGSDSDEDSSQAKSPEHVQMDIACGVLDLHDEAAISAAEAALANVAHCQDTYEASSDSDSSSSDEGIPAGQLITVQDPVDKSTQHQSTTLDTEHKQTPNPEVARSRKRYTVKKRRPNIQEL